MSAFILHKDKVILMYFKDLAYIQILAYVISGILDSG